MAVSRKWMMNSPDDKCSVYDNHQVFIGLVLSTGQPWSVISIITLQMITSHWPIPTPQQSTLPNYQYLSINHISLSILYYDMLCMRCDVLSRVYSCNVRVLVVIADTHIDEYQLAISCHLHFISISCVRNEALAGKYWPGSPDWEEVGG